MGYIVQSIVFDKNKGWNIKTARKWIKDHKEFSEPIKVDETTNTFRFRLIPPKKAEQMGFTDYRMKTLASGDVGIMLDIAYNKLKGGADNIEYEDEDPIEELQRAIVRLKRIRGRNYRQLTPLMELFKDTTITENDRNNVGEQIRIREQNIREIDQQIKGYNDRIQFVKFGTGGGIGKSKAKVAVIDAETERRIERQRVEDAVNRAYEEYNRVSRIIRPIEDKLYRIRGNLRGVADTDTHAKIQELEEMLEPLYEERNIYYEIMEDYQSTGGSLANEDLQALLSKSYHSKHPSDYKDFQVDKELSGQRVQVYHNPTTQQTVVAHRGSQSVPNWIENIAYAVSNDKSGKAFQHSKKIQDQAYQKYGKENITTIGHSKGALHAQEYGKEGKEVITLNKPVNITDALFTRVPKSQTDIRTQYDPVSFLRPFQRGSKVETIKSTTKNPLAEHKTSVLGRLDPRRLFGRGIEDDKENLDPNIPQEQHVINYRREEQRRAVQEAINNEIRSIYRQLNRERNDPRSLRTGLVPPFDLEQQIGVITQIAPQLRDTLVERITGQRPVIDINNAVNYYRSALRRTLTTVLQEQQSGEEGEEKVGRGMMCPHCGVNCCCGMLRGGVIQNVDFNGINIPLDMSNGNNFVNSFLSWYLNTDEDRADRYMDVMNRNDIIIQLDNGDNLTLPEFLNEIQGSEFQELIDVFEEGNNNVQSVRAIMNSGDQNEIRSLIMGMMDIVDETIQSGEERIQDIADSLLPDPNMNIVSDEESDEEDEEGQGAGRNKKTKAKKRKGKK
jgi:hypothetical protein